MRLKLYRSFCLPNTSNATRFSLIGLLASALKGALRSAGITQRSFVSFLPSVFLPLSQNGDQLHWPRGECKQKSSTGPVTPQSNKQDLSLPTIDSSGAVMPLQQLQLLGSTNAGQHQCRAAPAHCLRLWWLELPCTSLMTWMSLRTPAAQPVSCHEVCTVLSPSSPVLTRILGSHRR